MSDKKLNIKSWSLEDRPREKLLLKGKEALTDAELIAILIGSGNRELTAVGLSQSILKAANNNLHELGKMDISELMTFKGIGEAKAITITAALEIGRRRQITDPLKQKKISSSKDAYNVIAPLIADLAYEEFWVILLNNQLKVTKKVKISTGGVSATIVDAKILFKHAIQTLSNNIILVHNHPSGSLTPSQSDILLTKKLCAGALHLDIKITDHIIVSQNGYYSFADDGKL
ncbi:MAG: DNA repair protein RadC [Saprospiraceae bacterium]